MKKLLGLLLLLPAVAFGQAAWTTGAGTGTVPACPATTLLGNGTGSTAAASCLALGTNLSISGGNTLNASGGGSSAFSAITNGTNTTASAMVCGSGCGLTVTGTGVLSANEVNGAVVPASGAVLASNSSSQVTALTLGPTLAVTSGTLNLTAPNRTVTVSPTVLSTDMGGQINSNVSGGGTLTIPAISSTVFPSGATLTVVNYSASTEAISTTPTVNAGGGCVSGTGIPAGDTWQMISNGTSIDCSQTTSSGAGGGVSSFSGDGTLISNSSSTGAVTATLATTGVGYGVWGNIGASSGAPAYHALSTYPTAAFPTLNQSTTGNATTATTATNLAAGTANQIPYQTGAGATSFFSASNYGVQTYGATGVPASIAGAAGVLQGSAAAIPAFTTTPTLTMTNMSGTPSAITLTNAAAGTLPLTGIATEAANTLVANATGSTASPTAVAISSQMMAWLQANTTFTITPTGCTPSAHTGNAFGGTITLASGPCTSIVVTMNGATGYTAAHGFDCSVSDQTTQNAGTWIPRWGQTTSNTTTATIPIPAAAGATDVISFTCTPN